MQTLGMSLAKQWLPNSHEPVSSSHEPVSSSRPPVLVYLNGDLGSGKTTLAQGVLRGLGVSEAVTSPTYTLVEQYETDSGLISHLDLYRLERPSELSALGFEDIYTNSVLVIIEWPSKAAEFLPKPSCSVECTYVDSDSRIVMISDEESFASI
ncbi:MAG: tRNA (adenosine(37)-N6)-threonylcarbamoyltransferase complex ATPase subunit type 1 TsaE [Proteobacteria bacterium]|nr:tRNA (adenosine(37)-N6)-threonylcarbamoyltransferase complex ATPase subunit type 1 TsaE [Pseudomonadota bacterium]